MNLIYIYNMIQAKFIIKETKGQYIYKIGLGNKGDICISFYNNDSVVNAIRKWNNNNK